MAMTKLEKDLMAMTPEDRKKAVEFISSQMGMPPLTKEQLERAKKLRRAKKKD